MKSLWNIVSFLAIVHLLALLFFVAWLWQSERLSRPRLHQVRDVFGMTIPQAEQAAAEALKQEQQKQDAQQQEMFKANPRLDSAAQLAQVSLVRHEQEMALRRLENERSMLLQQLAAEHRRLDEKKDLLERQQHDWEDAVRADRQRKVDEQFLQAVRQLEQMPSKQGKQMVAQMISDNQMDLAVAYLDSMSPRASGKILREFKSEAEIVLANQLLEKLRTFGLESSAPRAVQAEPEPDSSDVNDSRRTDAGST